MTAMKLRSGASGPVFAGNESGDQLVYNAEKQGWDVTAGVVSSVFVVDRGTPNAVQNGSFAAPFARVQDALDAAKASNAAAVAVLLAPGFYQSEGALNFQSDQALTIAALAGPGHAGDAPAVNLIVYEGPKLVLSGIVHSGLQVTGDLTMVGTKTGAPSTIINATGTVDARDVEWTTGTEVNAEYVEVKGSQLTTTTLNPVEDARVIYSRWSGTSVVNIGNGPGNLAMDSMTLYYWALVSGTVNNGSVVGLTPD